ncbi:MAG: succinyl-diaminopimelate desuccinylase [Hyphomonadaceae bacterium]
MADTASLAALADPLPLAQALMRRPSVTPADEGALDTLQAALEGLGFACRRMKFGQIDNLFAKRGSGRPHLCFAGHTDVVPVGDAAAWSVDPFAATVKDGQLIGRGAADMKGAIAAFVAAVASTPAPQKGAISFLITGDEEGPAIDGTRKVLDALLAEGETFDNCLVGEPTSDHHLADVVKNGRRGSFNGVITVIGKQGHAAYPHLSINPVHALIDLTAAMRAHKFDDGAPGFDPSRLTISTIDVGNTAHNVVPARAVAKFNVRFNSHHTGAAIMAWAKAMAAQTAAATNTQITIEGRATGEAFYCAPGPFHEIILDAAQAVTGRRPALATTGGTSDARFLHEACPVAELGMSNDSAHMVDEAVPVEDLRTLARIYARILTDYFAKLG